MAMLVVFLDGKSVHLASGANVIAYAGDSVMTAITDNATPANTVAIVPTANIEYILANQP